MRRILIVITSLCLLLTSAAFLAGCRPIAGSGKTVSRSFNYTNFTSVETNWNFKVQITQSPTYSVSVSVDDNLQSYLAVTRDGSALKIDMQGGHTYLSSHFSAVITMPRLTAITVSGASSATASGFTSADDFVLNVSGASHAGLQVSGASGITLSGQALDADIESAGASTVDLTNFAVRDVHVDISGASNAIVNVTGTLSGDISGASHLYYTGSPTLGSLSTSGASSVNKK